MAVASNPHNRLTAEKALSREESLIVRRHLSAILSSRAFARSTRARDFLTMVVHKAIKGRHSSLRERTIGAELFGRSIDYDTGSDSIVRVTATEVRRRLNQFYLESVQIDWPVRLELPSGSYIPVFTFSDSIKVDATVEREVTDFKASESVRDATPPPYEAKGQEVRSAAPIAKRKILLRAGSLSILIAAIFAVAFLCVKIYRGWAGSSHQRQEIRSLVVLPLRNLSGDPNEDFIADGITAELINNLGQSSTLRVISLTSSMNLKGSKEMIPEIARDLKVQGVLEGSMVREGDHLRVSIELIDGPKDRPIWAETYVRNVNNPLNLQGEVAADIVRELTPSLSPQEQTRLARNHSLSAEAQTAYLHGLLLLHAEDEERALSYLNQAVQADPQFAQAHAALAECVGRLAVAGLKSNREAFSVQKSEALQAIALDPLLAEPHAELADAVMALDWDWQTAGKEYQRALELNPNSAEIHQKYAIFKIFQGDTEEAINQVEIGIDLDPTSAVAMRNGMVVYFMASKYDKVLSLIETSRSLGIKPPVLNFILGGLYATKGQYQTSIDWYLKAQKSPHTLGHLGAAYALAGQKAAALRVITALKQDVRDQGIGLYEIALVYVGLGDKRSAIQWLKRASDAHDIGLLYIKVDPFLDPLRSELGFHEIVKGVGLTP